MSTAPDTPALHIDLNSDLGESFGNWTMGNDNAVLDLVSSANIACGFHAGDPKVLLDTVKAAYERDVRIGAHIGYRDLPGFGRRFINYDAEELLAETVYQLGAIKAAAAVVGAEVSYVKPHGALYNRMATDNYQAEAVIGGILAVDPQLKLMAMSGTPVVGEARAAGLEVIEETFNPAARASPTTGVPDIGEARAAGLEVIEETFADRAYTDEGRLVSRREPGAVHEDIDTAVAQAVAIATGNSFTSINGNPVQVAGQSICVHGDSRKALEMVEAIIAALQKEGIAIC